MTLETMKYPCMIKNGELVTKSDCEQCEIRMKCDVYSSMLNELIEIDNDG